MFSTYAITKVFGWGIKIALALSLAFAFIAFLTIGISLMNVVVNSTILADIYIIVQAWLPFNLNVVLTWLFTASTGLVAYRLAVWALNVMNTVLE